MNHEECNRLQDMSARIMDVVEFLQSNDAENFTNEDIESLALLLTNISKVMNEMSEAPD
jgi:uncharacterized protein with HEPN domain